jgi:hypothetical protein
MTSTKIRALDAAIELVGTEGLGARDPVTAGAAIAACSEGLLLHNIARHDDTDPRPRFDLVVRATLA